MLINPKLKIHEYYIQPVLSDEKKQQIYDYLVARNDKLKIGNPHLTNFEILEHYDYFDGLYDHFLNNVRDIFGELTITEANRKCYAYVTSVNDKKSNMWHDHTKTSSINSVFYFSVPDTNSGKLLFGNRHREVSYEYQPKENIMLIFPDTLMHCPTHCNSEKYRIAINMELKCVEEVWTTLNH